MVAITKKALILVGLFSTSAVLVGGSLYFILGDHASGEAGLMPQGGPGDAGCSATPVAVETVGAMEVTKPRPSDSDDETRSGLGGGSSGSGGVVRHRSLRAPTSRSPSHSTSSGNPVVIPTGGPPPPPGPPPSLHAPGPHGGPPPPPGPGQPGHVHPQPPAPQPNIGNVHGQLLALFANGNGPQLNHVAAPPANAPQASGNPLVQALQGAYANISPSIHQPQSATSSRPNSQTGWTSSEDEQPAPQPQPAIAQPQPQ